MTRIYTIRRNNETQSFELIEKITKEIVAKDSQQNQMPPNWMIQMRTDLNNPYQT